ncbi:hypothetical protein BH23ACT5_BH23ACT5_00820 [soil metagenome]
MRPLLANGDREERTAPTRDGRVGHFGEEEIRSDQGPVVADERSRAVCPGALLVGHCDEEQVPRHRRLAREVGPERVGHRRREIEHVDGAPSPDVPVTDFSGEGIHRPPPGVDRYYVEVGDEGEGGAFRVAARYPVDHRLATGGGLEDLTLGPEEVAKGFYGPHLVAGVDRPVVHAAVADQLPEEVDRRGCHR